MPSTVVHVAVAGLLGTSLLAEEFDARAVLLVMTAAVFPDLDTFVGLWVSGGHRAVFHTFLIPAVVGVALAYDRLGERSWFRERWGTYGQRVAWVSLASLVVAGVGLDLFTNGVNVFYPIHDQFYSLSGKITVSNQQGVVQTFFQNPGMGTTETVHYSTGIDPTAGKSAKNVERVFPVVRSGRQLLLGVMSFGVVAFRVWETHKA